jgi:hypothetical protein
VNIEGFGAHSLRATAATNALDHEAISPIAVITLVLASASGQARAQFLDGNKLAEELRKSERTTDATYYEGKQYVNRPL